MLSSNSYICDNNLFIVPVCHYSMEFAEYVNRAFHEIEPDHIAVELPSTMIEPIKTAVSRFPFLSIVSYQNSKEELIYFPIEPTDPLCEGIRLAIENNVPVHFIDLDVDEYPLLFDPMPDSYAAFRIGLIAYWEEFLKSEKEGKRLRKCHQDELRESNMAYHLQKLTSQSASKTLLICGMSHVLGTLEKMKSPQVQPMGKVTRKNIRVYNLHPDSIREVTSEMPFLISIFEMKRGKHIPAEIPEERKGKIISIEDRLRVINSKAEKNTSEIKYLPYPSRQFLTIFKKETDKEKLLLKELLKVLSKKLSFLPEIAQDLENIEDSFKSAEIKPKSIEIMRENIFRFKTSEDRNEELQHFYYSLANPDPSLPGKRQSFLDRQSLILQLMKKASVYYKENTGEEIKAWQLRTMLKFARNYAFVNSMLVADFYMLIMSARGVADDNFAYEIWDLGSFYPWQDTSGAFQTINIRADEVWENGRKFTLRRRYPRLRERLMKIPVKDRKKERFPGEWSGEFNEMLLCSYPPEDIVIEGYGMYLKKKAMAMLSEEKARVEPFTNSLLDGIDMKETIRNWHVEQKIFVRENINIGGGSGSVVVIFNDDADDEKYCWKMTWLGEHDQESDMAFYATPMAEKIIGPGIARCEYGGLMLTSPPLRLYDVWSDPFYRAAKKRSEVLLMAAIEYSIEKHVVYVSATPPRAWFGTFASRLNKKIVYIPIGQLSPVSLKKLRIFHVLSGHHIRRIAKEYIW